MLKFFLTAGLCLICGRGIADDIAAENVAEFPYQTLEGHKGVWVVVAFGQPELAEKLGLRQATLEQFAVDHLTKAGVNAGTDNDEGRVLKLRVGIDLLEFADGFFAFSSEVSASQAVALVSSKKFALGETWATGKFGAFKTGRQAILKTSIEGCLDEFTADLKRANQPAKDPFGAAPEPRSGAAGR